MTTNLIVKHGLYKNLLTGGLSSSITRTLLNPIERIEILRQTQNTDYKHLSFLSSIYKLYNTQGIKGFFIGNGASIIRLFPSSAIEFYSLELAKNIANKININTNNYLGLFLCGTFCGLCSVTLTFPLDVVRTRLSINTEHSLIKEKSIFESIRNIYNENGIKGLYKGYGMASIGNILFIGIKQSTFEFLKINFPLKYYKHSQNLIYGFIAGTLGATLLYPNYVMKRRAQASSIIYIIIYS